MAERRKKPGRPHKPYRASWGEYINGLRRRKDGRWVIVSTGTTFVEPDERLAVSRFRRWQAQQEPVAATEISVPMSAFKSKADVRDTLELGASIQGMSDGSLRIDMEIPELLAWEWVREQLIERPEYAAQQTGIPELSRLSELPKPEPSPTFDALIKLYVERNRAGRKQRRQAELFWADFTAWMAKKNVTELRKLSPGLVAEYGDHELALAQTKLDAGQAGGSATYLKHRFSYIRSVISFARKRGLNADDVRHGLDCCAVLVAPKNRKQIAPHPIARDDFHRLLAATADPRMRAALITMLNLCMYPSEVLRLNWGDLDFQQNAVATDRNKTGVVRIGMLWSKTIEALNVIKPRSQQGRKGGGCRRDMPAFRSREGNRWSVTTLTHQFRKLRGEAGVDNRVKCEHLRDGAYTAAIQSGIDLTQAKLLAGHATGISDHYVLRRPTMVEGAVAGVYATYFG